MPHFSLLRVSHCTDPSVASALHSVVEPYLLRRVKSEVVKDLPVKTEVILYTGLSGLQKKYYKAILTKDLSETFTCSTTYFTYCLSLCIRKLLWLFQAANSFI